MALLPFGSPPSPWKRINSGVYDYIKPQTITDILLVGSNLTGAGLTALENLGKPSAIFSNDVGSNFYINHTAGTPGFSFGGIFTSAFARGTGNAPTTVDAGDWLGGVAGFAYDGTAYTAGGATHLVPGIWQQVTGTVASGVVERNVYIGGLITPAIGFDTNTDLITHSYPTLLTRAFINATNNANNRFLVNNFVTTNTLAESQITASDATRKPLVIQGFTSQTANLQEWQNSVGTVLASVSSAGFVTTPQIFLNATAYLDGATAGRITVTGELSVPDPIATGTLRVGDGATATGQNSTSYGSGALATSTNSVVIGRTAKDNGNSGAVALGFGAVSTGANSFSLGRAATAAIQAIAIGYQADAGFSSSVAFGRTATTTATSQFVAGADTYTITNVYFGSGVISAAPVAYVINGSGATGTDIAGANVALAGGRGTGTGAGGSLLFQTAPAGASGSSQNALVTRMTIDSTGLTTLDGNLSFTLGTARTIAPVSRTDGAGAGHALSVVGGAQTAGTGAGGALNLTGGAGTGVTVGGGVNITGGASLTGGSVTIDGGTGVGIGHVLIATARGQARFGNGTVAAPSIALNSSTGTGWYRIGADNIGLSIAGVNLINYSATKIVVDGDIEVESSLDGVILESPNATRWRITIDNSGTLITTAL